MKDKRPVGNLYNQRLKRLNVSAHKQPYLFLDELQNSLYIAVVSSCCKTAGLSDPVTSETLDLKRKLSIRKSQLGMKTDRNLADE